MKIKTKFPFDDYNGYIVTNPENRRNVCLVHKKTKKRTTISYARYLMSVKEKRILERTEEVDHKDGDKTNDEIKNLQILSKADNIRKSFVESGRTLKMIELECPSCKNNFIRNLGNSHIQKGSSFTVCSKQCLYAMLRNGFSKAELIEIGKKQIVRYFRK